MNDNLNHLIINTYYYILSTPNEDYLALLLNTTH